MVDSHAFERPPPSFNSPGRNIVSLMASSVPSCVIRSFGELEGFLRSLGPPRAGRGSSGARTRHNAPRFSGVDSRVVELDAAALAAYILIPVSASDVYTAPDLVAATNAYRLALGG